MDKCTQLWNQYSDLRTDLRQANALNTQILGFVIGAAALILTTGFKDADAASRTYVFLATYVVTFPGYQLLQGNRRHIWRLATYLRVCLEPDLPHVNWETDVSELARPVTKRKAFSLSSLATMNELLILLLINGVATVSCILLGIRQNQGLTQDQTLWYTVGSCVLFLLISIVTGYQALRLQRGGEVEKNYEKSWLRVRTGMEETGEGD
jgi:type III secretory pathway component EscS